MLVNSLNQHPQYEESHEEGCRLTDDRDLRERGAETQLVVLSQRAESTKPSPLFVKSDLVSVLSIPLMAISGAYFQPSSWRKTAKYIEKLRDLLLGSSAAKNAQQARLVLAGHDDMARWLSLVASSAANRTENLIHGFAALLGNRHLPSPELLGEKNLKNALKNGRGVVLWVGHFSFASLLGKRALADAGYQVSHVSRPAHGFSSSRFAIRFINHFRCAAEARFLKQRLVHDRLNPRATAVRISSILESNGIVSVTAGKWEGRHLATARFLNGHLTIATGAPAMAHRAGAALLPVFVSRKSDQTYQVEICAPVNAPPESDFETAIKVGVAGFFSQYEKRVAAWPDQWRSWNDVDMDYKFRG